VRRETADNNFLVASRFAGCGCRVLDARSATRYGVSMIRSFRHAGLEKFYLTGSKAGIQPAHAAKLRRQLTLLNTAKSANRMNVPGWELHLLKGLLADHWSVKVDGNWRMTFTFENENAILVDYQDYH
jgi:proteic killer suppression protein